MVRSCRLLHSQRRQPFEWNCFPLLTGRIVLSNKNRNLRKHSVVFFKAFSRKIRYLANPIAHYRKKKQTKNVFRYEKLYSTTGIILVLRGSSLNFLIWREARSTLRGKCPQETLCLVQFVEWSQHTGSYFSCRNILDYHYWFSSSTWTYWNWMPYSSNNTLSHDTLRHKPVKNLSL